MNQGMQSETSDTSNTVVSTAATSAATNAASSNTSLTSSGLALSPSPVTPIAATDQQLLVSGSIVTSNPTGVEPSNVATMSTVPTTVAGSSEVAAKLLDSKMPSM